MDRISVIVAECHANDLQACANLALAAEQLRAQSFTAWSIISDGNNRCYLFLDTYAQDVRHAVCVARGHLDWLFNDAAYTQFQV